MFSNLHVFLSFSHKLNKMWHTYIIQGKLATCGYSHRLNLVLGTKRCEMDALSCLGCLKDAVD